VIGKASLAIFHECFSEVLHFMGINESKMSNIHLSAIIFNAICTIQLSSE